MSGHERTVVSPFHQPKGVWAVTLPGFGLCVERPRSRRERHFGFSVDACRRCQSIVSGGSVAAESCGFASSAAESDLVGGDHHRPDPFRD